MSSHYSEGEGDERVAVVEEEGGQGVAATRVRVGASSSSRSRQARVGVEPAKQDAIPEWAAAMGIDLDDFRIIVADEKVDRKILRVKKDMVAFYRAHFEVGLGLPLDPFICAFLAKTKSVPIDLNMHTVRLLVCFAIVCRSLGFEPQLSVFFHFHTASVSADLISVRSRAGGPQMFKKAPNKIHHWKDRYILVESRCGWNFPVPRASCDRQAVPSANVTTQEDLAMVGAIRQALGVVDSPDGKFLSQTQKFDWNQLESNDEMLWLAGLTRKPVEGAVPWVNIPNQPSHEGWIIHFGETFGDECPSCAEGIPCPRKCLHHHFCYTRTNILCHISVF